MKSEQDSRTPSCSTNIGCKINQWHETTNKKEGKLAEQLHVCRFSWYQGRNPVEGWLKGKKYMKIRVKIKT